MQTTHLGRSGLQVSRLCLGTMNFGPRTPEPDAHAILHAAAEAGVFFVDTADVYGGSAGVGATEAILGRWFAGSGRREQTVLATKVFGDVGPGPNDGRLSARHIVRACEDSLRRLQTDRIDLYQMHHVDRRTPWAEIWQAMDRLIAAGKVLYVGTSNFAAWQIVQGQEAANRRHLLGLVSEQSLYNLNDRTIELEVLPACEAYGIGVLPWSPLSEGRLSGVLAGDGWRRKADNIVAEVAERRPTFEAWEGLCAELGQPPAVVALAWLLHQPGVTAPIVGPRTVEQLHGVLPALELRLDEATLERLDAIWPGPGGEAPEAYAW
jgi:aryl-alcohol dehydrogenase-like predicted oxidoreductase